MPRRRSGRDDFITVRVGTVPGEIRDIALNGDRTVKTALDAAGLDPSGYNIRVNGADADLADEVQADDTIILAKSIKGN
jgi:hypothetical protein